MVVRWLRRGFSGLALIALAALFLVGLGTLVPRPLSFQKEALVTPEAHVASRRILLLSNPIHTDIAFPADPDVLSALGFVSHAGLDLDYPGVFWVIVGWGSRSFYIETPTWSHLKPGPVFDAVTWDRSVMHVRRAGRIPETLDNVRPIDLAPAQFDRLLAQVSASFDVGEVGRPTPIEGAAYDVHDIFFPAKGGFNAFMGCNTWTARMLRAAGLSTGFWTPLPVTLSWSLDLHNGPLGTYPGQKVRP